MADEEVLLVESDDEVILVSEDQGVLFETVDQDVLILQEDVGPQGPPGQSEYAFYTQHSFAIGGEIVTGDTVPTFFVGEAASGQSVEMVKVRYKIRTGTDVSFKLTKNGADFGYGTTASPIVAAPTTATHASTQALNADDEIELVLLDTSGVPTDLTVTMIFGHTVF